MVCQDSSSRLRFKGGSDSPGSSNSAQVVVDEVKTACLRFESQTETLRGVARGIAHRADNQVTANAHISSTADEVLDMADGANTQA